MISCHTSTVVTTSVILCILTVLMSSCGKKAGQGGDPNSTETTEAQPSEDQQDGELGLTGAANLSSGSAYLPALNPSFDMKAEDPAPAIVWPPESGIKYQTTVTPPCPSQDGFTIHPQQTSDCLGYFRTHIPAGPLTLYYNSGSRETFFRVPGLTHNYHFQIRLVNGKYYLFTPTQRFELVALGSTGADRDKFKYVNLLYGDDIFTRATTKFSTTRGDDTYEYTQLATNGDYFLTKISSIRRVTTLTYTPAPFEVRTIAVQDLSRGGTTKTITITRTPVADPTAATISDGDAATAAALTFDRGFIKSIDYGTSEVQRSFTANILAQRAYPIAEVLTVKGVRKNISYFGYDSGAHLTYIKRGDEFQTITYWVDGATPVISTGDRFGNLHTTKFKSIGGIMLVVGRPTKYGEEKIEYDETKFPHAVTRTYDPRFGWTTITKSNQVTTVQYPDGNRFTSEKQADGRIVMQNPDGSRLTVGRSVANGVVTNTQKWELGALVKDQSVETRVTTRKITDTLTTTGAILAKGTADETSAAANSTMTLRDEIRSLKNVLTYTDTSMEGSKFASLTSTTPVSKMVSQKVGEGYTQRYERYGAVLTKEQVSRENDVVTVAKLSFRPDSRANIAFSQSTTEKGVQTTRRWLEPTDSSGVGGLSLYHGPIGISTEVSLPNYWFPRPSSSSARTASDGDWEWDDTGDMVGDSGAWEGSSVGGSLFGPGVDSGGSESGGAYFSGSGGPGQPKCKWCKKRRKRTPTPTRTPTQSTCQGSTCSGQQACCSGHSCISPSGVTIPFGDTTGVTGTCRPNATPTRTATPTQTRTPVPPSCRQVDDFCSEQAPCCNGMCPSPATQPRKCPAETVVPTPSPTRTTLPGTPTPTPAPTTCTGLPPDSQCSFLIQGQRCCPPPGSTQEYSCQFRDDTVDPLLFACKPEPASGKPGHHVCGSRNGSHGSGQCAAPFQCKYLTPWDGLAQRKINAGITDTCLP